MIIKKETPANNAAPWTKEDRKKLKSLVKEGKSILETAEILGRTPAAIVFQKREMVLTNLKKKTKVAKSSDSDPLYGDVSSDTKKTTKKVKASKKVKVNTKTGEISMEVSESPRDKAKEMASVARQVARANGKRITMAMFFVEDL